MFELWWWLLLQLRTLKERLSALFIYSQKATGFVNIIYIIRPKFVDLFQDDGCAMVAGAAQALWHVKQLARLYLRGGHLIEGYNPIYRLPRILCRVETDGDRP